MSEPLEQTPPPQNCGHDPNIRCTNCSEDAEAYTYFEPVQPDIKTQTVENWLESAEQGYWNWSIAEELIRAQQDTITSLTEQVESRTALLTELLDYVGRLESSMGWAVVTRGWYKFPEAGDLGDRVKAVLGGGHAYCTCDFVNEAGEEQCTGKCPMYIALEASRAERGRRFTPGG